MEVPHRSSDLTMALQNEDLKAIPTRMNGKINILLSAFETQRHVKRETKASESVPKFKSDLEAALNEARERKEWRYPAADKTMQRVLFPMPSTNKDKDPGLDGIPAILTLDVKNAFSTARCNPRSNEPYRDPGVSEDNHWQLLSKQGPILRNIICDGILGINRPASF
ncbi:GM26740 [Drosophila sechellia]|uniref:GM26740 n=1 Tax=Drosophila sechellia TaxID=7238 RepID=B4IM22_DROSE|nr:GM26740 [Drosophila sechellia]